MKRLIGLAGPSAILLGGLIGLQALAPGGNTVRAADLPVSAPVADVSAQTQELIDRGLAYLKTQQKADFGWQRPMDPPGLTALVLKAFVQDSKYDAKTPFVAKGYGKLLSYQLESGGIYKDMLANYNTAIAVSALAAARQPEFQPAIDKAIAYLRSLQWGDVFEGVRQPGDKDLRVGKSDARYGGFGYGRKERPDGSNMQMALDALHDAGLKPQDPAFQAALIFATRLQNRSESNDQPWAGNDGGFIYTPVGGGDSPAGEYTGPDGRTMFRSYGSMTYAGLKSMIYAGLTKDDPRVKACWGWIMKHWTFDENPGMIDPMTGANGLYYYFHTAARALRAYGEPIVTDAQGVSHDWHKDLVTKLASVERADGSWVGEKRWMEDNPVLATAYSVLALEEVQKDVKEHAGK